MTRRGYWHCQQRSTNFIRTHDTNLVNNTTHMNDVTHYSAGGQKSQAFYANIKQVFRPTLSMNNNAHKTEEMLKNVHPWLLSNCRINPLVN